MYDGLPCSRHAVNSSCYVPLGRGPSVSTHLCVSVRSRIRAPCEGQGSAWCRRLGMWSMAVRHGSVVVAVISLRGKSASSMLLSEASRQAWEETSEGIPQGLPGNVGAQHPFPYGSTGSQALSQYSRRRFNTFTSPW